MACCARSVVQIQPRKHVTARAGRAAPTRQHELDHTDHTDHRSYRSYRSGIYICGTLKDLDDEL